jgi:uncharacterized protein YlxW (UPF0749 family)
VNVLQEYILTKRLEEENKELQQDILDLKMEIETLKNLLKSLQIQVTAIERRTV